MRGHANGLCKFSLTRDLSFKRSRYTKKKAFVSNNSWRPENLSAASVPSH